MNSQNGENLEELFEKLLGSERANEAAEEIGKAEQILREHPAPEPHQGLIADIKAEIAASLLRSKANVFRRTAYKAAVAAAAVIVLVAIGVRLFEKGSGGPKGLITAAIIPATLWESADIAADDADLAVLFAEVEQIEGEALALRLGENGDNRDTELAELETELIEIDSNFWKG